MASEDVGRGSNEDSANVLLDTADASVSPGLRLQMLTTEHWSLLSTRALSWNEAFSRATMFLSVLSGAVLSLALVSQASGFDERFTTFALLLLPVVLFIGVATFMRLVAINREDVGWVAGMNLLRHAYLAAAPDLRRYIVTGSTDDEAGIMTTYGARPGPGSFAHELVTTPGVVAVVDGVVAGILTGIVAARVGLVDAPGIIVAVGAALLTVGLQLLYQYRGAVHPRGRAPRFPRNEGE